jgi:hypothetical protein
MRHFFLLLALLLFAAIATAQQDGVTLKRVAPSVPIPLPDDLAVWEPMVKGLYVPIEVEALPLVRETRAANNTCPSGDNNNLPAFNVSADGTTYFSSDLTIVNGYTVQASDPLVCTTSPLPNGRGYRTAWYRFIAPATGQLTVTTLPNFSHREDYDTIVSVLKGSSCAAASVVACNDDANGFLSQVDLSVDQGQTYFIEVADYNLEVSGEAKVNISVRIDSADFSTTNTSWNQTPAIRSRHIAKVINDKVYVFGGQTIVDDDAPTRTGTTHVFNPADGTWQQKATMPGVCSPQGYSNTDAAYYVNQDGAGNILRRVFFPSGYVGDAEIHSGKNCVYDVNTDRWSEGTDAPFIDGDAPVYTSVLNFSNGFAVVGGLKGRFFNAVDDNTSRDVYTYFVDNDLWLVNTPFPPLPNGRYAHTGVTLLDQFMCVTGGVRSSADGNVLLTDTLCLNITLPGNGWQTIAGLNIPRFNASSAIGADGSWIVYGGVSINSANQLYAVPEIEIYDVEAGEWVVLDDRFDIANPARTWASGGVVAGDLWAIGGEANIASNGFGGFITNFVERVANIPRINPPVGNDIFLPFMARNKVLNRNLQAQAIPIGIGQLVENNFNETGDRFDVYAFTAPAPDEYVFTLTNVPSGDNYDIYLYLGDKTAIDFSDNVGNSNERIAADLSSGLHYLVVVAEENPTSSPTQNYRLLIQTP